MIRSILYLSLKLIWKCILCEDRMHFRIILSRLSQHIYNVSPRSRSATFPVINNGSHLHSICREKFPCQCNRYIIRHDTALHKYPRLSASYMQDSDERFPRAFDYLGHYSFSTLRLGLLSQHTHPHNIAIQRTQSLGSLYEHILAIPFGYHKNITLTGHLHPSFNLWEHLLFLSSTSLNCGLSFS